MQPPLNGIDGEFEPEDPKMRCELATVLVVLALLGAEREAAAQPAATFTGLGFVEGSRTKEGIDVSADGSAIIGEDEAGRSFFWTEATGAVRIEALSGPTTGRALVYGLSDDGSVAVGRLDAFSLGDPMRWSQATGIQLLGALPSDSVSGEYRAAEAASADGSVIVGHAMNGFGHVKGFRWTAERGMQDVGRWAFAVSANGAVVGGMGTRWTEAGGEVQLAGLPGGPYPMFVRDLSHDGAIMVGDAGTNDMFTQRAVLWHASSACVRSRTCCATSTASICRTGC
ncbi:MAG: hypothetical protein DCC71_12840 [Proteobacteria bacterium]|nr:MAG: hypothetical protein DCC71_12840 [Pseudomonadota bacterium]